LIRRIWRRSMNRIRPKHHHITRHRLTWNSSGHIHVILNLSFCVPRYLQIAQFMTTRNQVQRTRSRSVVVLTATIRSAISALAWSDDGASNILLSLYHAKKATRNVACATETVTVILHIVICCEDAPIIQLRGHWITQVPVAGIRSQHSFG
jgi:hypothetical protein